MPKTHLKRPGFTYSAWGPLFFLKKRKNAKI